ncbi:MAG: glycine--tRNA ligase, partial [Patescibacteria group bacterium]|nr:glycine--tRNA ligase [Patescibacteria group bacterium]
MVEEKNNLMDKIESLCKRRGFVFPDSEIYGGMANTWDYGPYGAGMRKNIKDRWWKKFVQDRDDMVGLDAALIMNPKVWEASGHLANFKDPMVECEKCHGRFREDDLEDNPSAGVGAGKCPDCEGKLTAPKQFNMMFKTFFGPAEESANVAYFRPETAQGIFVNFKNIIDTTRKKLPFGIGQIGKAFRNEITPGNFIFRTREFEQMEIEYFIPVPKKDKDWEKYFEDWRKEMIGWIKDLGIDVKKEIHEL